MTSPDAEPEPTDEPAPAQPASPAAKSSLLPEQSREDTDAAWGDHRERDDDRLHRDRPPHWDDF
jgi:hypothetical protein